MLFNTTAYILFFLFVLIFYWIIPNRFRNIFLLIVSYFFYMQWNSYYIVLLVAVTIITYVSGLLLEKNTHTCKRLLIGTSGIVICLGILGIFKYFNFAVQTANRFMILLGQSPITWTSRLILPVGISFYTLQSLGYLIDVYRKEILAERNIIKYAVFLSFFPQLVAGPIERSKNLLQQLSAPKKFSEHNLRKGLLLMLWGLFVKMVIADRIAIFVDTVFSDSVTFNGFFVVIATILFSIQIYCDFYGYSTIARGTALTLGIELMDNFNAPYFSQNIKEFWQRWHISLSSWFRDYLYIPLGGNRKGKIRQMINLLIVFGISGLWHGASLAFVFWGFLNGFYQVISLTIEPLVNKAKIWSGWESRIAGKAIRMVLTFSLISFAWLFFRAGGIGIAKELLANMVMNRNWNIFFDDSLYGVGIDRKHFTVLTTSIILLFGVDYRKYRNTDVAELLLSQYTWFRVFVEILLIVMILLFGCYGELYDATSFIYFQF